MLLKIFKNHDFDASFFLHGSKNFVRRKLTIDYFKMCINSLEYPIVFVSCISFKYNDFDTHFFVYGIWYFCRRRLTIKYLKIPNRSLKYSKIYD